MHRWPQNAANASMGRRKPLLVNTVSSLSYGFDQGAKPDRSFANCFNCTTGFGGNPREFEVDYEWQNKNSAVNVCALQKQVRTKVRPRIHAKSCSEPTANRVKTGWDQFFPKRPPFLAVKWRTINTGENWLRDNNYLLNC